MTQSNRMQPNPAQPDRCPSFAPHDGGLQCGRKIHDDDQCRFGGIAWKKGDPPLLSDHERAKAAEAKVARVQALLADESKHLRRWIDDSHLVDVTDVRAALDSLGTP